ncbi:MAG: metallophosphoesterase [Prevotella sp.]|nr:metallophosphoesterase [Prevotella sp.]
MKKIPSFIFLFIISICCIAQENDNKLRFRKNGEFKILQFTDCHYKWAKSASEDCLTLIESMTLIEDVDLIVFTGDNVYANHVEDALNDLFRRIRITNIPFIVIFGNHDHQFDMTQNEQWDFFRTYTNNCQPDRPANSTYPDFVVPIYSSKGDRISQLIYNFDTHAGYKTRQISRYDWLWFDQIVWYRQQSKRYTRENGGTPIPSISFIHIPIPEYAEAYDFYSRGKKNEKAIPGVIGTKKENVSCPKLNSGFFKSILECGDIRAIFCGHDHNNDFALTWHNILLAYGRFSGGNTVYNDLGKNGARLIVLHENSNKIDTYIRLVNGDVINNCVYPDDFEGF